MDDAPFLGTHRVHLNRDVALQRLLRSPIGPRSQNLPATLSVAGNVEHNPFSVPEAPKRRLESKQLQGVDGLTSFADQQPVIIVARDDGLDPLIVLGDLNLTIKVELVENPLDKLLNPRSGLLRPFTLITHAPHPIPVSEVGCSSAQQRRPTPVPPAQQETGWSRTPGGRPRKCLAKRLRRVIPVAERHQHRERSASGANLGSFRGLPPGAWRSFRQRRRFFFLGGGGGGLAAAIAAGEGTAGAGMKRFSAYCCPIVQKLVVIQ